MSDHSGDAGNCATGFSSTWPSLTGEGGDRDRWWQTSLGDLSRLRDDSRDRGYESELDDLDVEQQAGRSPGSCYEKHPASPQAEPSTGRGVPRLSDEQGQELLERFVSGDEIALDLLIEAYSPMLFSIFLRRYRLSGEDAEDLLQDVLMQLLVKADRVYNVRKWLIGTGINLAKKRIRQLISHRSMSERYLASRACDRVDSAENAKDLISRGLRSLRPGDRRLLSLLFYEGLSYKEVSSRLGRPIGSIGPQRRRVLSRLERTLVALDAAVTPPG